MSYIAIATEDLVSTLLNTCFPELCAVFGERGAWNRCPRAGG
jgi:hypothetical protein